MDIIKLGTTCAIYPRLENRVEVELWYFKIAEAKIGAGKTCTEIEAAKDV